MKLGLCIIILQLATIHLAMDIVPIQYIRIILYGLFQWINYTTATADNVDIHESPSRSR